jgi:quercetin dioxygenase-like cupin family protein
MSVAVAADATLERVRFGAGGGVYHIVATAAETRNTIYAFEATEPPGGGPPLHTHAGEDEFFLVLDGEISFYVGGRVTRGKAGDSAYAPRGVPHCFKNTSTREARLLVLFTPANIEGFFDEYGAADEDGHAPPNEVLLGRIRDVGPRYGLQVLGPSPL